MAGGEDRVQEMRRVRAGFQVEARLWFTDLKPEQTFASARKNVPGRQNSKQIPLGKNYDKLM